MEPVLSRLLTQLAPRAQSRTTLLLAVQRPSCRTSRLDAPAPTRRVFSIIQPRRFPKPDKDPFITENKEDSSYSQPAGNLSQTVTPEEKNEFKRIEEYSKEKQRTSPWTRQGSDLPPVSRPRSAGAMTKGKLLTTPSRMLKFIIPLSTNDTNSDRKDVEPLALLVHPQQPLSYLERLIQSELPVMDDGKPPEIVFRAEDTGDNQHRVQKSKASEDHDEADDIEDVSPDGDETRIDGKITKTGKLNPKGKPVEKAMPAAEPVDKEHPDFVRWSSSTEIGDFIRDAARAKEFALDIEGAGTIYVGVPSFADRTFYLRMRLKKTGRQILQQADLKKECDRLAHRSAKQLAQLVWRSRTASVVRTDDISRALLVW